MIFYVFSCIDPALHSDQKIPFWAVAVATIAGPLLLEDRGPGKEEKGEREE